MPEIFTRVFRSPALAARFDRFLTEQSPQAVLNRSLAILILITCVTAWFSDLFFWPDEHYQVLEFLSYKLGHTAAADLPWEFRAQMRSWMQPFLYYLIAKPLLLAGIRDLFTLTFFLRLATGALGLWALAAFARLVLADLARPDEKNAFAKALPFMGFLPYLFVRTASETAAAAFFTLGLVYAVQAARSGSWRRIAAAGLFCGLAFACRYQSAFLGLGLFAWLVFIGKARKAQIAAFVTGGLAAVAAALLIDRWGYGHWCFPPWNYFAIDLLHGMTARVSGTSPFYAYFYLLPGNIFAPIIVLMLAALVLACLRNPRHYVTWPTAAFFLAHCLLGHKEERFLFPLAILATSYPVLAFSPGRAFPAIGRLWQYRRSLLAKFTGWSAVAAMLFLAVYPFGIRPHMKMAKYLYRHFPRGLTAYTFEQKTFASYPMYRPPHYRSERLLSRAELARRLAKGPIYLFTETPTLPQDALPQGTRAELLYSEFVFARDAKLAPWGTRLMCDYANLRKTTPVHPPRLAWMTLFKLSRSGPSTAAYSPCTPAWTVPLE